MLLESRPQMRGAVLMRVARVVRHAVPFRIGRFAFLHHQCISVASCKIFKQTQSSEIRQ